MSSTTSSLNPEDSAAPSPESHSPAPRRWIALDALRGFSMFWLLGGKQILFALTANAPEGSWADALRTQFTHVEWDGFHFYDFIFPLFLFCMGVAAPLSLERRIEKGVPRRRLLLQSLVRLWWIIFLGWWVNGNFLSWDPSKMALSYSVLMMLGLGWMIAVILLLYTSERTQIIATIGILIGYWIVQVGLPFPGREGADFVRGNLFGDWLYEVTVGQLGAPWKSRLGGGWVVSVWNCGSMAMMGVFACRILSKSRNDAVAVRWLLLGGVALLILAWAWSFALPIVKVRWTSSYVLWCGGLSWILLGLFHALIAIAGWKRWASLFIIIGSNSILAYLISTRFISPFKSIASILFDGLKIWMGDYWHGAFMALATYGMVWLLLRYLQRRKIFLRI